MQTKTMYYILFDNHEQAMKLRRELTAAGLRTVISPTPRQASLCCGVSLMIDEMQIDLVRAYLNEHQPVYKSLERVEQTFNPKRDRYL